MTPQDPKKRGSILVVDDSAIVLAICRARLEEAGYEVSTRESALGTSAMVMRERPDAVLMDVDLPGLSGDQIAALIKKNDTGDSLPIIILHSSLTSQVLARLVEECAAAGYIQKTDNDALFIAQFNQIFLRARGK
jgi:CheY-like chemotaxis protein